MLCSYHASSLCCQDLQSGSCVTDTFPLLQEPADGKRMLLEKSQEGVRKPASSTQLRMVSTAKDSSAGASKKSVLQAQNAGTRQVCMEALISHNTRHLIVCSKPCCASCMLTVCIGASWACIGS